MKRAALARVGIAITWLACAASPPGPAEPPIEPPAQPLGVTVSVREGSFDRSHLSPRGVLLAFEEELESARVFAAVLQWSPDASPVWELELAASDYGEPDAYALELQAVLLRNRLLVATYFTKQAIRQATGQGTQLNIGPEQLAALGQRAIHELVRQLAADTDRLREEERVGAS